MGDTLKSKHTYKSSLKIPLFVLKWPKIPFPEGMGTCPRKFSSALHDQFSHCFISIKVLLMEVIYYYRIEMLKNWVLNYKLQLPPLYHAYKCYSGIMHNFIAKVWLYLLYIEKNAIYNDGWQVNDKSSLLKLKNNNCPNMKRPPLSRYFLSIIIAVTLEPDIQVFPGSQCKIVIFLFLFSFWPWSVYYWSRSKIAKIQFINGPCRPLQTRDKILDGQRWMCQNSVSVVTARDVIAGGDTENGSQIHRNVLQGFERRQRTCQRH